MVSEAAGGSPSSLFGPDLGPESQQQSGPQLGVQHIRVPQQYIAARYPLSHASISPDGMDIAVAGTRGLGLYSRRSGRWRLFGDVSQEREIMVQVYSLPAFMTLNILFLLYTLPYCPCYTPYHTVLAIHFTTLSLLHTLPYCPCYTLDFAPTLPGMAHIIWVQCCVHAPGWPSSVIT